MLELEFNGYYPLTKEHLVTYVPLSPGIYILAIRLVSGAHKTFFTSQTENLYRSLHKIAIKDCSQLPPLVKEHITKFQCYFTYFINLDPEYLNDVIKLINETIDPVIKLKLITTN